MLEIARKVDWREIEGLTAHLLSRLTGIDTSGPETSTAESVLLLQDFLMEDGIRSEIIGPDEKRCNLVAKIDGSGQREPLLLLTPLDLYPTDGSSPGLYAPRPGYDDGLRIHGIGSRSVKSLTAAYAMALRLVGKFGINLKRTVRFAAVRDSFGEGTSGLEYLVDQHLPVIEAEKCLAWGYPGHLRLGETDVIFTHTVEREVLILDLKVNGSSGMISADDASKKILAGLEVLEAEFDTSIDPDHNQLPTMKSLASAAGYSDNFEGWMRDLEISGNDEEGMLAQTRNYIRSIVSTGIQVAYIRCGTPGCSPPLSAEAQVRIYPGPGTDLNDCGIRAVAALEKLGTSAPRIAKATRLRGSRTDPDDEMARVLKGSCEQLSEKTLHVNAPCFFHQKLHLLRDLGICVYGFNPAGSITGMTPPDEQIQKGENISRASLTKMVSVLFDAVIRLSS